MNVDMRLHKLEIMNVKAIDACKRNVYDEHIHKHIYTTHIHIQHNTLNTIGYYIFVVASFIYALQSFFFYIFYLFYVAYVHVWHSNDSDDIIYMCC